MQIPAHIAFIMDGNGRWAKLRGLARAAGHKAGVEALRGVLEYVYGLGVKIVSVFAFSTENWSRPKAEIDCLFSILKEYMDTETARLIEKNVRIRIMGDTAALPPELSASIAGAVKATEKCRGYVLNIGVNYGGRAEITRAVSRALASGKNKVDEREFAAFLDTAGLPDPDLIIRPGGEQRVSNFMLWQSAYSEFYFTHTLWPQFGKRELRRALEAYNKRDRRYGTTNDK
ncbi:MAG: polyprenyl diphosphate synthase [Firmicutes bacterium]|nr:polyprenyl diphosphate synthase [Bacillota bacterium]